MKKNLNFILKKQPHDCGCKTNVEFESKAISIDRFFEKEELELFLKKFSGDKNILRIKGFVRPNFKVDFVPNRIVITEVDGVEEGKLVFIGVNIDISL